MGTRATYNVLFLCTGNSARSILAEALLNAEGQGRFRAFSAGSHPTGRVNPHALDLLRSKGLPTEECRSKSWDEFAVAEAPMLDFVITVCDHAAGEVCPIWPGGPIAAHWGVPDPAAVAGTPADKTAAFRVTFDQLARRVRRLVELPLETLDWQALQSRLNAIGAIADSPRAPGASRGTGKPSSGADEPMADASS